MKKQVQRSNRPLLKPLHKTKPARLLRVVPPWVDEPTRAEGSFLPVLLTPFVGRSSEVDEICRLITDPASHLVTLYGTAGTGKTRLSIAVAEKLQNHFRDGIYFVNLAPISRPELGLNAIAQTLGLRDQGQVPLLKRLQNFLQNRHILLILDNFEQVIGLGAAISELLLAVPQLKIMITSRVVLQLYGEHVYCVPMLKLPETGTTTDLAEIASNEAVRLFVQQASMGNSCFTLTAANATLIAELCVRLEGLPLAIELAAARCDVFSPRTLLDQLGAGNRFDLLVGRFANLPARQQTLVGAIDWSYQLLTEPEKQVFRKISLFVSCGTARAAQMLNQDDPATLTIVTSLLNKSLLKRVEMPAAGEVCFTMLETIREFAFAKLVESGELEETWNVFCDQFIELVEISALQLQRPNHTPFLKCLQANHPNILSALDHLIEKGDVKRAWHLGAFIWMAWWSWGYLTEGRQWLNKLLKLDRSEVDIEIQAHLLEGVGYLAVQQADNRFAQPYFEEVLTIWQAKGQNTYLAGTLSALADNQRSLGNFSYALELSYESLKLFRELGEKVFEATVLCNIAWQLMDRGKYETVQSMLEESIALDTEANHPFGVNRARICLGEFLWRQGKPDQAIEILEQSISFLRQEPRTIWLSCAVARLGQIYLCEQQYDLAQRLLEEALERNIEMDKQRDLVFDYSNLGLLSLIQNDLEKAEAFFQAGLNNSPNITQAVEAVIWLKEGLVVLALKKGNLAQARELLDLAGQMRQEMDVPFLPHTVRFILPVLKENGLLTGVYQPFNYGKQPERKESNHSADTISASSRPVAPTSYQYPGSELSKRESEVLELVAQGHQTSQIARMLVISPGTVNNHLNSIYSKLGVNSRTRAVRYALDNGLLS